MLCFKRCVPPRASRFAGAGARSKKSMLYASFGCSHATVRTVKVASSGAKQGVLSIMGGCLGCFGRSDLGPVPSGRGNSASRWPLQLKLGDRRHAHMSSSDAEFRRNRPAGRAATAFFCMP